MSRGFLLGKFLPPHLGHQWLADFARAFCDELTILVCSLARESIPGPLRWAWMKELYPNCRVLHHDRDVPQEPSEDPNFWEIWTEIVKRCHPEPIDYVFASEEYGMRLAREVGAKFIPVDLTRSAIPVSGTAIRENPFRHWQFLPAVVRPHFVKTICLFGPESTGKTTLAKALASHYRTVHVPEFGRTWTESYGVECSPEDLRMIAWGQKAAMEAGKRQSNRLLITDTDPILTCVWSQMLIGHRDPQLDRVDVPSDLYLLTDIDLEWDDDGTRYFDDKEVRRHFFDLCRDELERRRLPYAIIQGMGKDRILRAIEAIDKQLKCWDPDVCSDSSAVTPHPL